MSLSELLPFIRALPRDGKFRLVQELLAELAQEGIAAGEYPVWSPYDAYEAAATLLQLLEPDNSRRLFLCHFGGTPIVRLATTRRRLTFRLDQNTEGRPGDSTLP